MDHMLFERYEELAALQYYWSWRLNEVSSRTAVFKSLIYCCRWFVYKHTTNMNIDLEYSYSYRWAQIYNFILIMLPSTPHQIRPNWYLLVDIEYVMKKARDRYSVNCYSRYFSRFFELGWHTVRWSQRAGTVVFVFVSGQAKNHDISAALWGYKTTNSFFLSSRYNWCCSSRM